MPDTLFEVLDKYMVEVPKVQRDYAQGRTDNDTNLVRLNLLSDIKASVLRERPPLDLNFVYGKVTGGNKFIPIDGQQRLTTLFLLHVYAFHADKGKTPLLKKFTYETRKSSRDFLERLVEHRAEIFSSQSVPSVEIEDSEWFVSGWKHDPTIQSSLVMLDNIRTTFDNVNILTDSLSSTDYEPIVFKFLDIEDLGMEDSLYIKLNARGKPLTSFENFKARVIRRLKKINLGFEDDFEQLFDGKWTDLFWESHREDFDRTFLMFFGVLLMNHNVVASDQNWSNTFDYEKLEAELFESTYHTLNYLANNPDDKEALQIVFGALSERRSYPDRVLFHAITTYLHKTKGIGSGNFHQWLRILRNLTLNTQIDSLDTYKRAIGGIGNLAESSDDLLSYFAKDGEVSGFSGEQIAEERLKARLIQNSEDFAKAIFEAEKHSYFSGQIRSAFYNEKDSAREVDFDVFKTYWAKVSALFKADRPVHGELLRRALLTLGDYTLPVSDYVTLCVNDPNEGERTPSMKRLFSERGKIVRKLLDAIEADKKIPDQLNDIISKSDVPADDWRYCFIKYPRLFERMSQSHLRLRRIGDKMLIVPHKSSRGYNYQVFLAALEEALKEKGVETNQESEQGTWSEHWMWIGEKDDGIYTKFGAGSFAIYRTSVEKEEPELLFKTMTDNPIGEAVRYIVVELK